MTPERLRSLLEKYLSNTASPEEEAELTQWYQAANEGPVEWPVAHEGEPDAIKARMLATLKSSISPATPRVIPFYRKRSWQIAAAVLLVLGAATWFTLNTPPKAPKHPATMAATRSDSILPGGNKATLTLADGSTIVLDTAGNSLLAEEGTTRIIKLDNGQLAYKEAIKKNAGSAPLFNTIRTPNGGQYQIVLPDGTRAWLNAASVLRFPISFTGTERRVQLKGEAYFDVAKNPNIPFKVEVSDEHERELNTIEVLGTGFNVNAYHNEPNLKTTLVEGKVKVSAPGAGSESLILTRGMQSSYSRDQGKTGSFQLKQVDTDDVIAWKNGLFNFNDADIKTVMRQLARWYDVEVVYEGALPDEKFDGEISRNSTISEVFKILELSAIHFKVEGRKVTVMP